MSKYIPGNQKHLTLEDRIYIENELNKGTSFKDIARFLCKDPTTISKEIQTHRLSDWYHKGTFYNAKNFCIHRYHCKKTNACGKISLCGIKCASCPTCNQTCKDFEKERCLRLDRAPYVCNGCTKKISHCTIAHKYSYNARFADRKYREKLRDSRTGINMTRRELHKKDQIISPLIEQGQSPYHILTNHPELDMSVRTMYSYLDQGLFTVRNIDLKRKVHFKPTEEYITPLGLNESSTKLLPKDTVLMAMYGVTAGEIGYLAIEATTNQAICGMICNSKANAAYLYFSLIQSQTAISRLSNGGAQDNLSKNFIDNIKIVVPPSEFIEKMKLAAIVEQMTLNTKEIAILEELQATALAQLSSC